MSDRTEHSWPTHQGPYDGNAAFDSVKLPAPLKQCWARTAKGGGSRVGGNGRVYVSSGQDIDCFDLAEGQFQWKAKKVRDRVLGASWLADDYLCTIGKEELNVVALHDGRTTALPLEKFIPSGVYELDGAPVLRLHDAVIDVRAAEYRIEDWELVGRMDRGLAYCELSEGRGRRRKGEA